MYACVVGMICAEQGQTVLMFAMENGLEALVDKLIEMGAEFHANLKTSYVSPFPCLQEVVMARSSRS